MTSFTCPKLVFTVMFGFFNINKPSGITSRDAVNAIQRLWRRGKLGHAGTLDPLASGVLVVGAGPATRLIPYVQRMTKQYDATFQLGRESDTEDVEGNVVEVAGPRRPGKDEILRVLPEFVGNVVQRPPAFSALKVSGKRAYRLARSGQSVSLGPRKITVHELRLVSYDYPELRLDIVCGSGTYVRSLGRDVAQRLGTKAVMSRLSRTAVGPFFLSEATPPDVLTADTLRKHLIPPGAALLELPLIQLTNTEVARVHNGLAIDNRFGLDSPELAAADRAGKLVAILKPCEGGLLRPVRCFL